MVPITWKELKAFFFCDFVHGYKEVSKYKSILGRKKNNILLYGNSRFNHEKNIFGIIIVFTYDGSINLYYGQKGLVI